MTEEIIIDGVDVAGCKFYIADDKYSCDLSFINQEELCKCDDVQDCYYKQLKRLEQELKWANDEEKYLKNCCIKAGKELEKHSFKWDGKEKNLVVQALQLNQLYEKLEQENKELKELNKKICEDWEKEIKVYWNALEEIRKIADIIYNTNCNYVIESKKILEKCNEVLNDKMS